jgi:hypothetical protein
MLNHLKNNANLTRTTNGAVAYKNTQSALLDLFAQNVRDLSIVQTVKMVERAMIEDNLLGAKIVFNKRDIRGGAGERDFFRVALTYLAKDYPTIVTRNVHLIPEYGRWDDLLVLFGTEVEGVMVELVRQQLVEDLQSDTPSLLGKWLPSENTSSKETVALATKLRKALGCNPKQYRKTLTFLRQKINIVETLLSQKKWNEIEYSKIPSRAGLIYRKAFEKNDTKRYHEFIEKAVKGEVKINSCTLYPHELVEKVMIRDGNMRVLDAMWKALPNYVVSEENSIVVADVSGSMHGTPMHVAISLAMYMAERNKGRFANHFITFSERPELIEIVGNTLEEKVRFLENSNWGYNTNLELVFRLILNTAKENRLPQSELPTKLYIVSDMQFDEASGGYSSKTFFQQMKQQFADAGYKIPEVVFWNVRATDNVPAKKDERGVALVSGYSPTIFANLMGEPDRPEKTPYETMLDVLNSDRYSEITI